MKRTNEEEIEYPGVLKVTKWENEIITAFMVLRLGKIDEFLYLAVTTRLLAPARKLLSSFGIRAGLMTYIWDLKWRGKVVFERVKSFKGLCSACDKHESIKYVAKSTDGDTLAYMGVRCFENKMFHLINLVDFCLHTECDHDRILEGLKWYNSLIEVK